MKKLFILTIAFILIIIPASLAVTDDWEYYQKDVQSRGYLARVYQAAFTNTSQTVCTIPNGYAFQPLARDWDDDGDNEIFLQTGTNLLTIDGTCATEAELNIGITIDTQPARFNNNTIAFIDSTTFYLYNISSSAFTHVNNVSLNGSAADCTGIKCEDEQCYFICDLNSGTSMAYNCSDSACTENEINVDDILPGTVIAKGILTSTATDDIAFACDVNNDGNFGICVIRADTLALNNLFSADGSIDNLADDRGALEDALLYTITNTDGGNGELLVHVHQCTAGAGDVHTSELYYYDDNGVALWSKSNTIRLAGTDNCIGGLVGIMPPVQAETFADGDFFCIGHFTDLGTENGFTCYNDFNGVKGYENLTLLDGISRPDSRTEIPTLIAADFVSDANQDHDLLINGVIVDFATESIAVNIDPGTEFWAVNDITGDNILDVIATHAGSTIIYSSNTTNNPPVVNNSMNYGGYGATYNYEYPICNDTTLTFTASENDGTFTNDFSSDYERIRTDCGQGGAIDNGTYAQAMPTFACYYNSTGVYTVRLYLDDEANAGDLTAYNTENIIIQVIDGTPGVTCNLGSISPGETGDDIATDEEQATNDEIDSTFGILFGVGSSSDKLKLIVGLAIVIAVIITAASYNIPGLGLLFISIIALIMVTFLGLVTPAILLIGGALMLLAMLLGRAIMGGGASQGGG